MCIYLYIFYIYTHMYVCVCVYICMYVYICVCMCVIECVTPCMDMYVGGMGRPEVNVRCLRLFSTLHLVVGPPLTPRACHFSWSS